MSGAMSPDDAIAAAVRRNPHLVSARILTPFDEMLRKEEAMPEDEQAIRAEAVGDWLVWLFGDGPRIEAATKRLFSFARAYRPELVLNMSGEEIAALFGQGRAAESARTRRVIEPTLKAAGMRCTALPYQKSDTARRRCAEAQKGNRNRSGKKPANLAA